MFNYFMVQDDMRFGECPEGSEDKFFIKVNDTKYLVKDSSYNKKRKRPSLAPYCEYVGSNFIQNTGVLSRMSGLMLLRNI